MDLRPIAICKSSTTAWEARAPFSPRAPATLEVPSKPPRSLHPAPPASATPARRIPPPLPQHQRPRLLGDGAALADLPYFLSHVPQKHLARFLFFQSSPLLAVVPSSVLSTQALNPPRTLQQHHRSPLPGSSINRHARRPFVASLLPVRATSPLFNAPPNQLSTARPLYPTVPEPSQWVSLTSCQQVCPPCFPAIASAAVFGSVADVVYSQSMSSTSWSSATPGARGGQHSSPTPPMSSKSPAEYLIPLALANMLQW